MGMTGGSFLIPKLFSLLTRQKTFILYEGWIAGYVTKTRIEACGRFSQTGHQLASVQVISGLTKIGRRIFYQNAATQCIRCHTVAGNGSNAGPDFTSIENRLPREGLLESLAAPTGRIASGFSREVRPNVKFVSKLFLFGLFLDERLII